MPGCASHGDNKITVLTEIPELGQGTRTANVMMLADELEVEWSRIHWEQAPTFPAIYKHLATGGSGGTKATWLPMRQAGAQVREMLLTAAAQRWGVERKDCKAENAAVVHTPTQRRLRYGELAESASTIPAVKLDQVPLKAPRDFRFIGKPTGRVDTPAKVDGSAIFGIDVRVPGMLFAVIARCPHFGGKLISCDDSAAKATSGVEAVFAVPPIGFTPGMDVNLNVAGGVAVVANCTWAALQGRNALKIVWDKGPGAQETSAGLQEQLREKASGPATVVSADRGNVTQALAGAERKIEADYEMPFQAHATMEPMNTTPMFGQTATSKCGPHANWQYRAKRDRSPCGRSAGKRHRAYDIRRRIIRPSLSMGLPGRVLPGSEGNESSGAAVVDQGRRYATRFLPAIFVSTPDRVTGR